MQVTCVAQHVVLIQDDIDGAETVYDVRFFACSNGARPGPGFQAMCHADANPYADVLWVRPLDRPNVEWLCGSPIGGVK